MDKQLHKDRRILEVMLVILVLGMTTLFYKMGGHGLIVLSLFFLPVVLSGYYLGRANAGVMALCCALFVTIATTLHSTGFAAYNSPTMMGLALTVWAAVLGLTALLVGTLCDERARTVDELQKAYVGVVDVLSRYLQSANPDAEPRSVRIAELSQSVARQMRLSRRQIDDIRVAALLHDLGNVEITIQLISKAVSELEANSANASKRTFLGADLVHSLGTVLDGALPLLVSQDDGVRDCLASHDESQADHIPVAGKIVSAARAYYGLTTGEGGQPPLTPEKALQELRKEYPAGQTDVIDAMERVVRAPTRAAAFEPAFG
jgi:hypothetical protein